MSCPWTTIGNSARSKVAAEIHLAFVFVNLLSCRWDGACICGVALLCLGSWIKAFQAGVSVDITAGKIVRLLCRIHLPRFRLAQQHPDGDEMAGGSGENPSLHYPMGK